jgi:glutathionylspermidine synthase
MWASSAPHWHGVARADFFETDQGLLACELNCDTPTGEPEAVLLNRAVLADHPGCVDPNAHLETAFCGMVEACARSTFGEPIERSLGLVYPTELTEDLPLVRLYQQWLEARGWTVVLGSPFNLTLDPSGVPALFGSPCRVILRHYKTDWWGERAAAWQDEEPFADALPLGAQLGVLFEGVVEGHCVVVNPFGSVLPQNKKAMAFMWERIQLFSEPAQEVIRRHIPYTLRLEALHREQLSAEREDWVLKSDYGCEGDELVIGTHCPQEEWDRALALAAPKRWIAQRYFRAAETPSGESVNYGVYLVGGQAAGIYCRTQKGPTNSSARSVPCLITPEEP